MTTGHRFDPTILREYDIRGLVGKTLFPADAAALGRAYGAELKRRGGRTVRCSISPSSTCPPTAG